MEPVVNMAEQPQAQLQGAVEMVRVDVTLLAAQCRSWAGALFRAVARRDKDVNVAYNNFVEIFWQLYSVIRDNAEQTGKIAGWAERQKSYDAVFLKVLQGDFMPITMLQIYSEFSADLRKCGIYDLSAGEWERWC
jgi:hypothetical protein